MIEEEIFKKSIILPEKLEKYGFQKEKDKYTYQKEIMNHEFLVIITIINNHISGKVIEKDLNEEYLNFRIENQTGEFVNTIREEFIKILEDIKENCTMENNFIFPQANRISNWIKEKYKNIPEYLWEEDDKDAVFRNSQNKKWYGIIMYINKKKLEGEDKKVEVMNVKLPPELINELVKEDGFYRAYHMNKKYWITFLLDDTIPDKKLQELIEISYEYTIEEKDWIVPANPKMWDIIHCFDHTDEIHWKQIDKIELKDNLYIYVGSPYSCIMYKCQVLEKDIPSPYVEFKTMMRIRLLKRYQPDEYPFEEIQKYDLRAIRGPRRMPNKLLKRMK